MSGYGERALMAPLLAFIPVALALTLVALAHDGGTLTRARMAQIAGVALVAGPLAIELVGFLAWLGLVAAAVTALTTYASLRQGPGVAFIGRE